jgi:hypothetical protein
MPDFPYVQTYAKTPQVFDTLRERGRPSKVTVAWLEAAGFKSKSDRSFIGVLKFLGVLDNSGIPTDSYDLLKQEEWAGHLAALIRTAYSDVFSDYPKANNRSKKDLIDQFRPLSPGSSQRVLDMMVATFLHLCETADFKVDSPFQSGNARMDQEAAPQPQAPKGPDAIQTNTKPNQNLTINVNIGLELPAVDNPAVYDSLFKSMAQHLADLLGRGE